MRYFYLLKTCDKLHITSIRRYLSNSEVYNVLTLDEVLLHSSVGGILHFIENSEFNTQNLRNTIQYSKQPLYIHKQYPN
jgi:hypothetical protein